MLGLLLVDIQNDFCAGGALEVKDGDATVQVANRLLDLEVFAKKVSTQDWHPASHKSFASNVDQELFSLFDLNGLPQVAWPDHCVQDTLGAKFHPELNVVKLDRWFPKGTDTEIDSYSGFFDNGKRGDTGLHKYLQDEEIDELVIVGLATDYCVKFTVLDALELGYKVHVLIDGCRGVNQNPGDETKAFEEMEAAGANVCYSEDLTIQWDGL